MGAVDRVYSAPFEEEAIIEEIGKAKRKQEIVNEVQMKLNEMKESVINSPVPLPYQLKSKLNRDIDDLLENASSLEPEVQAMKGILEEKKKVLD